MRKPTKYASNNGIAVMSSTGAIAHHITIRNNDVANFSCGCVGTVGADYVTIENNRVDKCGWYSSYGGSGISMLSSRNSDSSTTGYRNIVRGNVATRSKNLVPCGCYGYRQPTDGNGIIIDSFVGTGYSGKTLIENNVVSDNGGRGIHVFKAGNVDVSFNTVVRNGTVAGTADGEITAINASNVRAWNNVIVALADRPTNSASGSTGIDFNYNVVFGGNKPFNATGNTGNTVGVDPLFVNGSGNDKFRLGPGGRAIDAAGGTVAAPSSDAFGAPRPLGLRADVGAVESR